MIIWIRRVLQLFKPSGAIGDPDSIGYDFHLGNGDNGNVYGITNYRDNSRNQSFTYDSLNRLVSAQNAGTNCAATTVNGKTEYWGNSYSYDAWGNLLTKSVSKCGGENLSVTAGPNNQLQGAYTYDAAGNMLHDATSNLNYTYDQENRITGAAGYAYTYDGDGNRVKKSNGSTGTLYWYLSPGIVAESDLSGNLQSEYVFFDGERLARQDFPAGAVSYYFSDHLKTASVVTDAVGNIKEDEDYYPWGGELQFVNNDSNHYKFTGKERDSETGLDYFGARYYSNGLGRFITPDWSDHPEPVPYADFEDPQSLNRYSYVRNIPTVKIDSDGHCCDLQDAWDLGTGVVRGIVASASFGAVGAPTSGDSEMSLLGQTIGTGIEGGVSTQLVVDGGMKVGGGLLAEGPTAGGSTVIVVGGAIEGAIGIAGTAGAVKNNGAILNAMAARNPHGSAGAPDHQEKVQELVDKAKSEAKSGETVTSNKKVQGVESKRRPDAQILNKSGKTRKVFEAERHPNRQRNQKREAEYKKLKLKNETHPLK